MVAMPTINIPTELLRTLITVVDARSFTKAAHALGVTQPAVSAQIKRLQLLLGGELLDKSAPGVTLTQTGDLVVRHARQMLAINDQILSLVMPGSPIPLLRVGIPGDFAGSILPRTIAEFQARSPHLRFQLRGDPSDTLLREFRQGHLDLVVAFTLSEPDLDARHSWAEQLVWIRGNGAVVEPSAPVPLVTLREPSILHRITTSTLTQADRDYDVVFMAFSSVGLLAAVSACLGVSLWPILDVPAEVERWDDAPLPRPFDAHCGIYLREGAGSELLEDLADIMADTLRRRVEGAPSAGAMVTPHPARAPLVRSMP